MIKLVRGQNTGPGVRALKSGLTDRGIRARITYDPRPVGREFMVNWSGMFADMADINAFTSSDKLKQLIAFQEAGLTVPRFQTEWDPRMMGRTRYHRKGSDFDGDVNVFDFYVEPVKIKREWRFHVFRDGASYRVARVGRKVNVNESLNHWWDMGYPIRSRRFGWHIKYYDSSKPWLHKMPKSMHVLDFIDHAGWALLSQDWDMAACDIGELDNGKPVLLEANACPGINDAPTARVYLDYIERRYNEWRSMTTQGGSAKS